MSDDDAGRRPRTAIWVSGAVLVVLGLFVVVLARSEPATDRRVSSPLLGLAVPALAGQTLDGEAFELASLRGQFVVVNFFATWCTPCVREHPELVTFHERHRLAGDASVVSVLYDDRSGAARDFFEEFGGDWPVVLDPVGAGALDFGVGGVPESFVVAPDGRVVAKLIGGVTAVGLDQILVEVTAA